MKPGIPESALIGEPSFAALREELVATTGLAYYRTRQEALAAHVVRRMEATACASFAHYLARLQDGEEHELLVRELTIGETYFFRHRELFDALERVVLPACLERRQHRRTLRIWSAGCSTGEEPYTVSILLKDQFGARLAGWDVSILATDLNRASLARARAARYGEWSLRALAPEERARWFQRQGGQWELLPQYREHVDFQPFNLVQDSLAAESGELCELDLILCRNVLIYFEPPAIERLVRQFQACLAPGGWLCLGHAEATPQLLAPFQGVSCPGATVFQRPARVVESARPAAALPAPRPGEAPAARPSAPRPAPLPAPLRPMAPAGPLDGQEPRSLEELRAAMDRGDWPGAEERCRRILERTPLDARLHGYSAVIHEQLGSPERAEEDLRRALYLDRGDALAHYRLALLRLKAGDHAAARRSLANAQRLVERAGAAEWGAELSPRELGHLVSAALERIKECTA